MYTKKGIHSFILSALTPFLTTEKRGCEKNSQLLSLYSLFTVMRSRSMLWVRVSSFSSIRTSKYQEMTMEKPY